MKEGTTLTQAALEKLLVQIRACQVCQIHLPLGPNPVLRAHSDARILIVGQAPGIRVHQTGLPWNDPSGDRLRSWLNVSREQFYDEKNFAIIPMGYCYPGTGKMGDLPPRKECRTLWLPHLLKLLPNIKLTLLLGRYAQIHFLKQPQLSLTATVAGWRHYLPTYLPLPHPSPRNNIWFKKNPWFIQEVVPYLAARSHALLNIS